MTDREIDALIVEKLFNLPLCGRSMRDWPRVPAQVPERDLMRAGVPIHGIPPHYCSSWDGAGIVVEEMRRRGWSFNLCTSVCGRYYCADFSNSETGADTAEESAPRAIALAALRALGVEVGT